MRIMTCNIRYYGAADGDDSWVHRKDFCTQIIDARTPDIICFQEMWREQFEHMQAAFPNFDAFGIVDEPQNNHPVNTIFYRRDSFELVSPGGSWLSENPHVTGSSAWESACVRLVNWVRLIERPSNREFRVVNTHLDHISQPARENQARLICEDTTAYPPEYPQLLTGDMNCDTRNPAITVFLENGWHDTYEMVHHVADPGHTFHGFKGPEYVSNTGKMDWVFCRGNMEVIDAEVITDDRDGRFPSDHYFITADVRI